MSEFDLDSFERMIEDGDYDVINHLPEMAAEIRRLREDNARMREVFDYLSNSTEEDIVADIIRIREETVKLQAENAKMREALEFYADEKNYYQTLMDYGGVFTDTGKIARCALEEEG